MRRNGYAAKGESLHKELTPKRKYTTDPTEKVSVCLPVSFLERLDDFRGSMARSEFIRLACEQAMKPWNDPSRSAEDRAAWLAAEPKSLGGL